MARFTGTGFRWRDGDDAAPQHGSIDQTQYTGTKGDDHIHGRKTPDTIDGRGGDDVLNARYGDDTLNGDRGNDVLKGSAGRDMLYGGAGDDIIFGGTERQEVDQGGAGRDQLFGGAGDDRLYGGWEADGLTGGGGRDLFVYGALSDSTLEHSDTILDFVQGSDKLVFTNEFRNLGNLHFIGDAPFSDAAGEVRFAADADSSIVEVDLNGDGVTDSRIIFTDGIQFQASDFSF